MAWRSGSSVRLCLSFPLLSAARAARAVRAAAVSCAARAWALVIRDSYTIDRVPERVHALDSAFPAEEAAARSCRTRLRPRRAPGRTRAREVGPYFHGDCIRLSCRKRLMHL